MNNKRRTIKTMILYALIAVALAVGAILITAALQPSDYRVERSAGIAAPPAVVFAQVNDLHKFQAWSPWARMDPNAKNTFEGADAGAGAIFHWAGNSNVGEGIMTITASKPGESVSCRLDFLKPFPGTSYVEFTFKPDAGGTLVTWSMTGKKSFLPKIFCLFMSMDKMVGGQFEKGLAELKTISESAANR